MFLALLASDPIYFLLRIASIIIALSFHEFFHAYLAFKCGDNTAKDAGRLTLNPLSHIDITGLLFMLLLGFGWAKPVLINPSNLSKKEETFVAAAGPLSNLFLAAISGGILHILGNSFNLPDENLLLIFMENLVVVNVVLFLFNLIPLYPLDGSRIFLNIFIDENNYEFREKFIQYGPRILMGIIIADIILGGYILGFFLGPMVDLLLNLFL